MCFDCSIYQSWLLRVLGPSWRLPMVDLVFRLGRRGGILVVVRVFLVIRVFLVEVGKHYCDSFLLWAVACHVAFLLTQKALAIHLQLYLLATSGRVIQG